MEFKVKSGTLLSEKSDAAVICIFEGEKPAGTLLEADKALGGLISSAIKNGEYSGRPGEVMFFHRPTALKGGPAKDNSRRSGQNREVHRHCTDGRGR